MHQVPPGLLAQVVATYAPRRVLLFGSRARGDARPDSDIDLMVVLDDDAPVEMLSWEKAWEARRDYHGAVDILSCREGALQERARARGSFAHQLLRDGVVLYERAAAVSG